MKQSRTKLIGLTTLLLVLGACGGVKKKPVDKPVDETGSSTGGAKKDDGKPTDQPPPTDTAAETIDVSVHTLVGYDGKAYTVQILKNSKANLSADKALPETHFFVKKDEKKSELDALWGTQRIGDMNLGLEATWVEDDSDKEGADNKKEITELKPTSKDQLGLKADSPAVATSKKSLPVLVKSEKSVLPTEYNIKTLELVLPGQMFVVNEPVEEFDPTKHLLSKDITMDLSAPGKIFIHKVSPVSPSATALAIANQECELIVRKADKDDKDVSFKIAADVTEVDFASETNKEAFCGIKAGTHALDVGCYGNLPEVELTDLAGKKVTLWMSSYATAAKPLITTGKCAAAAAKKDEATPDADAQKKADELKAKGLEQSKKVCPDGTQNCPEGEKETK